MNEKIYSTRLFQVIYKYYSFEATIQKRMILVKNRSVTRYKNFCFGNKINMKIYVSWNKLFSNA